MTDEREYGAWAKAWVLTWNHWDNSAHGVIRAYLERARGTADLEMLREHADDKHFDLIETTLEGLTTLSEQKP